MTLNTGVEDFDYQSINRIKDGINLTTRWLFIQKFTFLFKEKKRWFWAFFLSEIKSSSSRKITGKLIYSIY